MYYEKQTSITVLNGHSPFVERLALWNVFKAHPTNEGRTKGPAKGKTVQAATTRAPF
jgi:hypothetical protein